MSRDRKITASLMVVLLMVVALYYQATRAEDRAESALEKFKTSQIETAKAESAAYSAQEALKRQCRAGVQSACAQLVGLKQIEQTPPPPDGLEIQDAEIQDAEVQDPEANDPSIPGPRGDAGNDGVDGSAGLPGASGERGSDGSTGATGDQGPQGLPGEPGPQGRDGAPGVVNVETSPACAALAPGMSISLAYDPSTQTVTLVCTE